MINEYKKIVVYNKKFRVRVKNTGYGYYKMGRKRVATYERKNKTYPKRMEENLEIYYGDNTFSLLKLIIQF